MKIQRSKLELFTKVLNKTNLTLTDARIRDAFIRILNTSIVAYNEDKMKVFREFCDKNKDGTPQEIHTGDGTINYHFPPENTRRLNTEVLLLNSEEAEIEVANPIKIKEYIEKTEYEPAFGEVEDIDMIITLLV